MNFLDDVSMLFDNKMANLEVEMMEAVTTYVESVEEFGYVTEVAKDTIGTKIKKFFANLIATMQNLKSSIQTAVEQKVRDAQYRAKLDNAYSVIMKKKEAGEKTVEILDLRKIEKELECTVSDMKRYAKKLCKMEYSNTLDINRDIEAFNKNMDLWNQRMEKVFESKKMVSINEAIVLLEYERSGKTKCLDSINDCITILKQMENDVKLIETRKDILGPDIVPKYDKLMRRTSLAISSAIKKWVVKIVSTVVFVFA